jgi:non-ribosomal peptide synthase protein (TIGR01720 family)
VQAHAETDVPVRLEMVDLAAHDEQDQDAAIRRKSARLQAGLNLTEGPLLRAAWFKLGARRPPRLLVAIHHLVVDGVSWRVLLEDLETLCRPTASGQPARLPPKTTSFQAWARKLRDYAQSTTAHEELDYWLRQTIEGDSVPTRDFDRGEPTEATARVVSVELDAPTTQALLQDVPRAYQTQINDVLLTATALALAEWTGSRRAFLNLEGHGREDIASDTDLSRTVGWFTTMFAVCLDLGDASEPGDALKTVKEQVRRIPRHGIGYGALRYLGGNESAAALAQRPMPRVSFNYLGQFDATPAPGAVFRLASAFFGPMYSRRARRPFDVEINALVTEGRLRIDVSYSAKLYRRRTIQRFARGLFARLEEIIRHCTSPDAGGFTPSDFPEADMTQDELDALLSTLDNSDEP